MRHNLSLRRCFVKNARISDSGKVLPGFWSLQASELPDSARAPFEFLVDSLRGQLGLFLPAHSSKSTSIQSLNMVQASSKRGRRNRSVSAPEKPMRATMVPPTRRRGGRETQGVNSVALMPSELLETASSATDSGIERYVSYESLHSSCMSDVDSPFNSGTMHLLDNVGPDLGIDLDFEDVLDNGAIVYALQSLRLPYSPSTPSTSVASSGPLLSSSQQVENTHFPIMSWQPQHQQFQQHQQHLQVPQPGYAVLRSPQDYGEWSHGQPVYPLPWLQPVLPTGTSQPPS